jgi:hypothetical protein
VGGALATHAQMTIKNSRGQSDMTIDFVAGPSDYQSAPFNALTGGGPTSPATQHVLQTVLGADARARQLAAQEDQLRGRIQSVLQQTTGFARADDPDLWQAQWDDYSGTYTPVDFRPYERSTYNYSGYVWPTYVTSMKMQTYKMSCFSVGTPVWTASGKLPIEKIKAGDRVLSQDLGSGELAIKPVERTTLRNATEMIEVDTGSHSILSTQGHPFWVNGRGWHMAKSLAAGQQLHSVSGAVAVDDVRPAKTQEAYNLVVSDWHSYFVGDARVLVHDNSPMLETPVAVPGFTETAEAP